MHKATADDRYSTFGHFISEIATTARRKSFARKEKVTEYIMSLLSVSSVTAVNTQKHLLEQRLIKSKATEMLYGFFALSLYKI